MRVYEYMGGPQAWAALPYLRFDFANERDGQVFPSRKHLWDRRSGRYRVEWQRGDSTFVVLFNTNTRVGTAFVNGDTLAEAGQQATLERAYGSFINDTYWLLMPVKLLDPGVHRAFVPDSSDAHTEVITLSFDEVGLTPGDRYWVFVDKATGQVREWAYRLQSFAPEQAPTRWRWTGYEQHTTAMGLVRIATRKESAAGRVLLTNAVQMPEIVPDDLFTDPRPRLFVP